MYILLVVICISICISILIISQIRFKSKQKQAIALLKSEQLEKIKEEIEIQTQAAQQELKNLQQDLKKIEDNIAMSKQELASIYSSIDVALKQNKNIEQQLYNSTHEKIKKYELQLKKASQEKISSEEIFEKQKMTARLANFQEECDSTRQKLIQEKDRIVKEIDDYKKIQDAINESIRREREINEQQDFFRVGLSEDCVNDIQLLQSIRKNLKKTEIIDKIIYDNYIAKPVLEMIKRVLQNSTCSGIYKITYLDTGEIYIGKSTDIKNRWQQHCKTVFNCGTIASSLLHSKMREKGLQNFTFELVEKVEKDQLSQREKFWINFYKSKEYGLNERNG